MENRRMELKLFTTLRCNFRCTYCYVPFKNQEIDPEVVKKAISLVGDDDTLNMFGGEPLLFKEQLIDMVEQLEYKNKHTALKLFTNGSIVDDELTHKLATTDRNVLIQISYDGTDQMVIHGTGQFSLAQLEENIKYYIENFASYSKANCNICSDHEISEYEKTLHIEMTVTPDSIKGLAPGVKRLLDMGITSIGIVPVIEVPEWSEESRKLYHKAFSEVTDLVIEQYRNNREVIVSHLTPYRGTNGDQFGCGAGKHLFSVDPDGELWTCHRYYGQYNEDPEKKEQYTHGNIRDIIDLKEFEDSKEIPVLMKNITCGTCPSRQFCTKCHLANKLLNGDENETPKNGYCYLPAIHRQQYERLQRTLQAENNQILAFQLQKLFLEALPPEIAAKVPEDATIEQLAKIIISAHGQ